MTEAITIRAIDGKKIDAIYSRPTEEDGRFRITDETLIIMIHDFPGNKAGNNELYADLEFILGKEGCHTIRYDCRGCGSSDKKQQDFTLSSASDDLKSVMAWGREKGYSSYTFVAEGMGAVVAAMNVKKAVNSLMLFWPILDLKDYGQTTFQVNQMQQSAPSAHYVEVEDMKISSILINEMFKIDMPAALKSIAVPVMAFHGAKDERIPIEHLDVLRENARARRIEITSFYDGEEGLSKLNHRQAIFYQAQQFVERYA